jgi:hypothetical protein
LDGWRDIVQVADTSEAFAAAIQASLAAPVDHEVVAARLAEETWTQKAEVLRQAIAGIGHEFMDADRSTGEQRRAS